SCENSASPSQSKNCRAAILAANEKETAAKMAALQLTWRVIVTENSEHDRSIPQGLFSLYGSRQRILADCDCIRARVLQLPGLNCVELHIFREFRRNIRFRIDGVHRAYVHACHTINAILRVNNHLVLQFIEAGDGTHLDTVGELASATFVGHDVRHGIVSLRLREETALNPRLNQGCPLGQFLSQYQTKPVAADVHGRSGTESQRKR